MSVGEINKGAIALLLVLVLGAAGYLWFTQMYQPAVEERTLAEQSASTAEATLASARQQLADAQQRIEDAKKESAKLDDSVPKLALARAAVPDRKLLDDAAIVLVEMADRSGVQTSFKAGSASDAGAGATDTGALQGAVPLDLEFEAAGTYAEMMNFMSLVESTVEVKGDKLHSRGRLFNVVKLEIGGEDEDSAGGAGDQLGAALDSDELVLGPNDVKFTVVVRMYTSSVGNAENVGATVDPAMAGTDPNAAAAGGGAASAGATTDPATGAATMPDGSTPPAGTDPNAANAGGGAATGMTDPAAGGATAPAAAAPTGGGI